MTDFLCWCSTACWRLLHRAAPHPSPALCQERAWGHSPRSCSSWSETLPSRCCLLGPSLQDHEASSWQHLPQHMEKVRGKSTLWPCSGGGNNLVAKGTSAQDGVRMAFIPCEQLCDPPGHAGMSAWAAGRHVPMRWDGPRGQRDTRHPVARLTAR